MIIADIGCGAGHSTNKICRILNDNDCNIILAIDLFEGKVDGSDIDVLEYFYKNTVPTCMNIIPIKGSAIRILEGFPDKFLDFAHYDIGNELTEAGIYNVLKYKVKTPVRGPRCLETLVEMVGSYSSSSLD